MKTLPISAFYYLLHTLTNFDVETNGLDPRRRNTIPFWYDCDRASLLIRGNKMPTRCNRWFFIADLIACSTCFGHHYAHHQELESIIQVVAACGIWCFGFQGFSRVMCPVCGPQPASRTHDPQLHTIPTTWKPKHQIPQATTTCIILSSSWWWA